MNQIEKLSKGLPAGKLENINDVEKYFISKLSLCYLAYGIDKFEAPAVAKQAAFLSKVYYGLFVVHDLNKIDEHINTGIAGGYGKVINFNISHLGEWLTEFRSGKSIRNSKALW